MKTKKTTNKPELKFTTTEKWTDKEFRAGIKEAERGPFYSVEESVEKFEKWRKEREKK